jgi:hypothetical protein
VAAVTRTLAVVGAGAAGCAAADALRDTDVAVTVFEKSRGLGGQAATRRRDGCRYDHGANYVKYPDRETVSLLQELGDEGLVTAEGPVWPFDADGEVSESDRPPADKWTWTEGITQLGKRLLARAGATVHRETRVERLVADADGWRLFDDEGESLGRFDGLLLTPPAPQTAALLADTRWDDGRLLGLREAVGAVTFTTVRTVVLHYPFEQDRPWYALVNADDGHEVGWLAREECKPGHVPDGESLLVVQMGTEWSEAHYDDPLPETAETVAGLAADLVGDERLRDYDWADDQGWRYAAPETGVDTDVVRSAEDAGLFFAGDWVAGKGRVHAALANGRTVGDRIAETLVPAEGGTASGGL